jgi:L-ribulose-5-phosphate 3-epimerase
MGPTRRRILAGMAGALGAVAQTRGGAPTKPRVPAPPRTTPAVCLYSKILIKVEYDNLGMVLRDLGFDGCDLSVEPGGHVPPEQTGADLSRAIEACTGVGLDVPILTTSFLSGADQSARQTFAIAGFMGVPLFRPGYWKYNPAQEIEARLGEVQREMTALASAARAYNVATCIHNQAGDTVGGAIWDTNSILRGIDPRWVGYDFDPGAATEQSGTGGSLVALRLALPRLKAVTVTDFYWAKDAGGMWKPTPCPLGEGMVDWPRFFAMLGRARFAGPISIEMRYQPANEIAAIRHDLEFVRKQLAAAYPAAG